ncbi:phage major capsid protein [Paenibacillus albiflavus]|uniref:Phage major capsid protein n=1 Tax=Paenibacillus albiflavus TaxID=2545760 RepID=A0A4V2WNN7_9BACL|nr:phage major capsid protein [Paenibacillus albiflavus]TCZ76172.1 phage major capsid protein [Paenibacillus albiflavus]
MDEKERELRQKLAAKLEEARNLAETGKTEEARKATNEAKEMRSQLDVLVETRELQGHMSQTVNPTAVAPIVEPGASTRSVEELNREHRDAFVQLIRGKDLTNQQRSILSERRAMNSTSGEDGGFLIPPDIQVMINEIKRQYVALSDYVTMVPVSTLSGSRVLEKFTDITPLTQITAENTELSDLDNPKVKQVPFTVKDYGGIMTLTNNLLADSPENILSFIAKWIARKEIITDNKLILDIMKTFKKVALSGIDDIKKVLNVELDPLIASSAIIVTNQDGYNFLDTLKDGFGRPLLQPDPTQPTRNLIFGKPVVVMANRLLPTSGTTTKKAPMIIGDLQESVVIFDRQEISILTTNIGGKAFETNTTKTRVIDREDVVKWDDEAMIYGEISLP